MKKLQKHIARLMMAAIFLTAASATIFAQEQAVLLTQKQANDAMHELKQVREAKQSIMHYCDPCTDKNDPGYINRGKTEVIKTLSLKNLGKGQFNVLVNGTAVDLAYVYIPNPRRNGKNWINLGRYIGILIDGTQMYK